MTTVMFDIRGLTPEKRKEIYPYIAVPAVIHSHVYVNNELAGFLMYYENGTATYLTELPHECQHRDVTGWDLTNPERALCAAFPKRTGTL